MNLPQLRQDLANHFVYGTAAAVIGAHAAQAFGIDRSIGAFAAAAIVGVAKEAYDKVSKKGSPTGADAIATAAGALPVVLVL